MRVIDHLVYCVPDLHQAMKIFSEKCGVEVVYGGQHLSIGTHNALLNIGNGAYLEFLAIDPSNTNIQGSRWMGMDLIDQPTFTRWAIKTNNLEQDTTILKKVNAEMGNIFAGSRKKADGSTLNWAMALPLALPEVEILPFMIDWKDSIHPTATLATGCQLLTLGATHPTPELVQPTLNALGTNLKVKKDSKAKLYARIQTPMGILEI